MIGYKITPSGKELIVAFLNDAEMFWLPGVNYGRLADMAKVLNRLSFDSDDGYFSVSLDHEEDNALMAVKALERDGYIERSTIPGIERYLKRQEAVRRNPRLRFLLEEDE